jgi:hypothetical protein
MTPSFIALIVSGLLVASTLIYAFMNSKQMDARTIVLVMVLLSVAVATHGMLHFVYEVQYKWNPLTSLAIHS